MQQCLVETEQLEQVQVTVRCAGAWFSGQLSDASLEGTGAVFVAFPGTRVAPWAIGEKVELTFELPQRNESSTIAGRVIYRSNRNACPYIGFECADHDQLKGALSLILKGLSQHGADGWEDGHPTHADIPVSLLGECTEPVTGELVEISKQGMSVLVSLQSELRLANSNRIMVSFYLPECKQHLNIAVQIRDRRLEESRVHYCLEFDWEHTRDAGQQQEAILTFVLTRICKAIETARESKSRQGQSVPDQVDHVAPAELMEESADPVQSPRIWCLSALGVIVLLALAFKMLLPLWGFSD